MTEFGAELLQSLDYRLELGVPLVLIRSRTPNLKDHEDSSETDTNHGVAPCIKRRSLTSGRGRFPVGSGGCHTFAAPTRQQPQAPRQGGEGMPPAAERSPCTTSSVVVFSQPLRFYTNSPTTIDRGLHDNNHRITRDGSLLVS